MYSRMVPPAIAPIVVTEQFTSSFDHTAPRRFLVARTSTARSTQRRIRSVRSLFASCKLSDQQMARIALLVYAGLLHRGAQVRKPAKYAAPQSLAKHLGNAA